MTAADYGSRESEVWPRPGMVLEHDPIKSANQVLDDLIARLKRDPENGHLEYRVRAMAVHVMQLELSEHERTKTQ